MDLAIAINNLSTDQVLQFEGQLDFLCITLLSKSKSEVEDLQQRCRTLELALEATKASASSMRDDVTEAGDRAAW